MTPVEVAALTQAYVGIDVSADGLAVAWGHSAAADGMLTIVQTTWSGWS